MIFKESTAKDGNILLTIKFNRDYDYTMYKEIMNIIDPKSSANIEDFPESAITYLRKMPKLMEECMVDLDAVIITLQNNYGIFVKDKNDLRNIINIIEKKNL